MQWLLRTRTGYGHGHRSEHGLDVGLVVVVARREAEVLSPELRVDVLAVLCGGSAAN